MKVKFGYDVVLPDYVDYLTPEKEYEVVDTKPWCSIYVIIGDDDEDVWILLEGCGYLSGSNWQVVEE